VASERRECEDHVRVGPVTGSEWIVDGVRHAFDLRGMHLLIGC
jgi:hypothetical protein